MQGKACASNEDVGVVAMLINVMVPTSIHYTRGNPIIKLATPLVV